MRLPKLEAETMTARQREIAERIAGRRGAVRGPFQVWLNSPEACDRIEALGAFLRFESSLPLRLRELSLLLAARQLGRAVLLECTRRQGRRRRASRRRPWTPSPTARSRRSTPTRMPSSTTSAASCSRATSSRTRRSREPSRCSGPEGLVDTVASLGNFTMLCMCLNTFEVDLQPDREPPYPDVRGHGRVISVPSP